MKAKCLCGSHTEVSRSKWINVFPSGAPEFLYVLWQDKTVRCIPHLLQKEEQQVDTASFIKHVCKQLEFSCKKNAEMLPILRLWHPQLVPYETDLQKRLKVLNQDYATLERKYSKFYLLPGKFHRAKIRNNIHLPRLVPCSSISPPMYPNSKKLRLFHVDFGNAWVQGLHLAA